MFDWNSVNHSLQIMLITYQVDILGTALQTCAKVENWMFQGQMAIQPKLDSNNPSGWWSQQHNSDNNGLSANQNPCKTH